MASKKKHKKNLTVLLYVAFGFIVFWLFAGFFIFFNTEPASIYVYPENPKQGDTVFIRVKSQANEIAGNLGQEKLVFYKKGSEWISFLGIDADQNPGEYKIFVDTSSAEHFTEKINVAMADFSSAPVAKAPSSGQTGTTQSAAVNNIRKSDNPAINKILGNFTLSPYFAQPFSYPLSKIEISGFSFGKFIGFAKDKLQHLGVDLRAPQKTDVFAVNDGKVVAAFELSNYGKTVIIDHGLDIFSLYLHLDEFKVSKGDIVRRGQSIGLSGETGYVTAPHLHFSIRVGGARVDPIAFIKTSQKMNNNFFIADISNAFLNFINNFKK